MLTAPLTNQYTFLATVPLVNITLEYVLVERAPYILITNTALALPCAFKYRLPVKVVAAFIIYVCGVRTRLFPN